MENSQLIKTGKCCNSQYINTGEFNGHFPGEQDSPEDFHSLFVLDMH